MVNIKDFFDKQQKDKHYGSLKAITRDFALEAADILNNGIRGDTLSVGGIWDFFAWNNKVTNLSVIDLSPEMLKEYCPKNAKGIVGDFYDYKFPAKSYDTIVFPLMLHHTPQGSWSDSEERVKDAIKKAKKLLKKDGQIYILEYCPQSLWMPLQQILFPITKWFLEKNNQPLVAMYSLPFYEKTLNEEFKSYSVKEINPPGFNSDIWYPVFMSIQWLKIPFNMYPKLHMFRAWK